MKTLLCGVALLAIIAMPAAAETAYDRNLEKAVMDIVAGKIGEIRGGFSYGLMPKLVVVPEAAGAASSQGSLRQRRFDAGSRTSGLAEEVLN